MKQKLIKLPEHITLLPVLLVLLFGTSCSTPSYNDLQKQLTKYVADKDAKIGIAIIIDSKDTVTVNANDDYPMQSVYKFPQALAIADYARQGRISIFNDTIAISAQEMRPDTYSPMRDRYGTDGCKLALYDIMAYSLQQSDNNACDVLFRLLGTPQTASEYISSLGIANIKIVSTENEMHEDQTKCFENTARPLDMAKLLEHFAYNLAMEDQNMQEVKKLMESCTTGNDRLPKPLAATNAVIGHKTGTGDRDSTTGRLIAVNDVGYINLPNGRHYSIVVFIKDSGYDLATTSGIIGDISTIVFNALCKNE